jgi:signal transduction histidine kinase
MGTAGIGFNVEEFFSEALPPTLANQISYQVKSIGRSDGTKYVRPVSIFESRLADQPSSPVRFGPAQFLTTSFTLPFGGALLQVEVGEAKSNLVGERDQVLPFFVLVGGLLFFGMASALSRKTLELNRALIRTINLQTSDLTWQINRAKQLEQELTHVAEDERQRIGHELHDDLGQRLTGLSLSFKELSETLQSVSSDLSERAEALERNASDAIASVRGLAHGLMPVPAGRGGLREALEQLAASVSSLHVMRCIFDFDDPVDVDNTHVATNLYRIAQEAVNNAMRHSRASVVKIRLDEDDGKVTLTVSDNGIGFQHDSDADTHAVQVAGAGLRIMAHRASVINFRFTVDSSIDGGTTIKAQQC